MRLDHVHLKRLTWLTSLALERKQHLVPSMKMLKTTPFKGGLALRTDWMDWMDLQCLSPRATNVLQSTTTD